MPSSSVNMAARRRDNFVEIVHPPRASKLARRLRFSSPAIAALICGLLSHWAHFLDTGHFADKTHAKDIAAAIRDFVR